MCGEWLYSIENVGVIFTTDIVIIFYSWMLFKINVLIRALHHDRLFICFSLSYFIVFVWRSFLVLLSLNVITSLSLHRLQLFTKSRSFILFFDFFVFELLVGELAGKVVGEAVVGGNRSPWFPHCSGNFHSSKSAIE